MSEYTDLNHKDVEQYNKDNDLTATTTDAQAALHRLYPQLEDNSGNLEELRTLVKYPFLIYLYGGGILSISEGVGTNIMKAMIKQLDRQQKAYNSAAYEKNNNGSINFNRKKNDQNEYHQLQVPN